MIWARSSTGTRPTSVDLARAIVLVDLVALGLWIVASDAIAPRLIADAYHGHGFAPLAQRLARTSRRPLEHYLGLWNDLAGAVSLGVLAHAGMATIGARLGWRGRRLAGLAALSAAFLALTIGSGPRQDYVAYLEIWKHVRAGGDPWWIEPARGHPLNAYGPLFNAFAPLAGWNPLAPKLAVATAYLLGLAVLGTAGAPRWALLVWALMPSSWLHVAWYGHFDLLVGLAIVAGWAATRRARDASAGTALGLGILLKYFPIVLAPFWVRADGRWRPRVAVALAVVVAAGLGAAWWIWGPSPLEAPRFAASRPSQMLSIARFLRGRYSPLRTLAPGFDPDPWATPFLLGALAAVWVVVQWRRLDVGTATVAAVYATLVGYKVGFAQYQTVGFVVLVAWCVANAPRLAASWGLRAAIGAYLVWIAAIDLFDWAIGGAVGGDPRWAWVEDVVGLPSFVLGAWLVVAVLTVPGATRPSPPRGSGHRPGARRG